MVLHEPVETLTFTLPGVAGRRRGSRVAVVSGRPTVDSLDRTGGGERTNAGPSSSPAADARAALELRVVHTRQPMPELSNEGLSKLSIPLVFPAHAQRQQHHASWTIR